MNRAERRAANAGGKRQTLARDVAIHEAGHAVARILTASDFGYPAQKCIVRIDVEMPNKGRSSIAWDGSAELHVQATSFGLMFSSELIVFFEGYFPGGVQGYAEASPKERQVAFEKARLEGIAVDKWLEARLLIDVFGAAAEAKFADKAVGEVWNSYAAEGDFEEAVFAATMAGLDTDATKQKLADALDRAAALIDIPEVWQAVQAVADVLPAGGSVAGNKVFQVASRALGQTMRT